MWFCLAVIWVSLGIFPAVVFEYSLWTRYGSEPDECSAIRLLIAAILGPIASAGISVVMSALENDDG